MRFCEPAAGKAANLIVPPGKCSVAEIMKDLGRGIPIAGFIGGISNSTTGDMSIGIVGQLFENRVPAQPVSEMNMADDHLNLWKRLIEVGNDPYPYSSAKIPSPVFRDVVVSGIRIVIRAILRLTSLCFYRTADGCHIDHRFLNSIHPDQPVHRIIEKGADATDPQA